jgi:hypothetical protein
MIDKAEVKEFLAHMGAVYDPAKAHEYYLKNRELKGLAPAAPKNETKAQRTARVATSQKKREARMYVGKQLRDKRQGESSTAQAAHKARMEKIRKSAEASRKRIDDKLNKFLADLNTNASPVKQTPLNKIPANATPKVRAFLEKQNAKISASNKEASDKAAADLATKKSAAKKSAGVEMKRVGTELKTAVATARATYAASKQKIQTEFKTASATEQKNIKDNVR